MRDWEEVLAEWSGRLRARPDAPRLGVDTGGTFTDFVLWDGSGPPRAWKAPSQPADPGAPIRAALAAAAGTPGHLPGDGALFVGTTVGTNALLEARGARTALVTTAGFEDVLEIGRQERAQLYALWQPPRPTLVPPELRFGVAERIGPHGEVERPLAEIDLPPLIARLRAARVEAVAVLFLHSWINDAHERRVGAALAEGLPGIPVTLSCDALPEIREYERAVTTVAGAFVGPVMGRYLDGLAAGERAVGVALSSGGITPAELARRAPARTLLSGPAAGCVAARRLAQLYDLGPLLTFDMGGTSTDCAWIDPAEPDLPLTTTARLGGWPVAVPAVDLVTVGAGGGSIARLDAAGALAVGPESAGADPGPAARGVGRHATVTDAALLLDLIPPGAPLPAGITFDRALARAALARLADALGGGRTPEEVAAAVLQGALSHMERALRAASAARGHDPRGATLLAFGGAGGLFAAELAARLEMRRVVVPPAAGAFSAWGALVAPRRVDWGRSVSIPAAELDGGAPFAPFWQALGHFVPAAPDEPGYACFFGARYPGQSHELLVPADGEWEAAFHALHRRRAGHADPDTRPVITTLRVVARSLPFDVPLPVVNGGGGGFLGASGLGEGVGGVLVLGRAALSEAGVPGPALLVEVGATLVVPEGHLARALGGAGGPVVIERLNP